MSVINDFIKYSVYRLFTSHEKLSLGNLEKLSRPFDYTDTRFTDTLHGWYQKFQHENKDCDYWTLIPAEFQRVISEDLLAKFNPSFPLHENAPLLSKILELNEVEEKFLSIMLFMEMRVYSGEKVFDFIERYFPAFLASDYPYFRIIFGFTRDEINSFLTESIFAQCSLLSTSNYSFSLVPGPLTTVFSKNGLTEDKIKKDLFPSLLDTNLDISSYEHIRKECDITESILSNSIKNGNKGINILLWGVPGTGKTELALIMAKKLGVSLISIGDISSDNEEQDRTQRLANLRIAQKLFSKNKDVVILFDEMEDIFLREKSTSKSFLNRILEKTDIPIIWTCNHIGIIDQSHLRRMTYNIEFKYPDSNARKKIWSKYVKDYNLDFDQTYLDKVAETHKMTPALIHNAVKVISSAEINKSHIPEIIESLTSLHNYGVSDKTTMNFIEFNRDKFSTDFINADSDIKNIAEKIKKASRNFSLCLYGPAGTGKSEYGKYVADLVGKRILYKRASDLKSMWQGETEKLIAGAFEEANEENRILLIDEGDSFIRDRNNEHFRPHEVAQVNEMLSQMEMQKCTFILTTNLMDHLDQAALRRFTFKIKFDYTTAEQNDMLFKRYFGVDAPIRLKGIENLTPGDFKNVKDKVDVLELTDPQEIFKFLEDESRIKNPYKTAKIGF